VSVENVAGAMGWRPDLGVVNVDTLGAEDAAAVASVMRDAGVAVLMVGTRRDALVLLSGEDEGVAVEQVTTAITFDRISRRRRPTLVLHPDVAKAV